MGNIFENACGLDEDEADNPYKKSYHDMRAFVFNTDANKKRRNRLFRRVSNCFYINEKNTIALVEEYLKYCSMLKNIHEKEAEDENS